MGSWENRQKPENGEDFTKVSSPGTGSVVPAQEREGNFYVVPFQIQIAGKNKNNETNKQTKSICKS